jgi:hypothetical protein
LAFRTFIEISRSEREILINPDGILEDLIGVSLSFPVGKLLSRFKD